MCGRGATLGLALVVSALASAGAGCRPGASGAQASDAGPAGSGASTATHAAVAATQGQNSVAKAQPSDEPMLGITAYVATVYEEPRDTSRKLGYLRVGSKVARSVEPVGKSGCPGGWYKIHPVGHVCAGPEATTDLEHPALAASKKRPNLGGALPYRYGFVRSVLPLYLRVPTKEEQLKSEFKLEEHLAWYAENKADVDKVALGSFDVPLDARGVPMPGKALGEVGAGKNSTELPLGVLFGGETDDDPIPDWLAGGKRTVPNISDFKVPEYAVFADRARRHTGLAFIGSFKAGADAFDRRFGITTDLRLAPTTKVKPDSGSAFHGVELGVDDGAGELTVPLAFVRAKGAQHYRLAGGKMVPAGELEFRAALGLTGKMKTVEGVRYFRTKDKRWLHQHDVGLALAPEKWPEDAEKGKKWIDISIEGQTLTLWEGKKPVYSTLVSTGRDGLKDPKTTLSTVRGTFKIRNKHITATMDSNESTSVGGRANTTAVATVAVDGGEPERPRAGSAKERSGAKKDAAKKGDAKAKGAAKTDPKADPKAAKKPSSKPGEKAAPKGAPAKGGAPKGKAGEAPSAEYVPKKGDGLYGVSKRRGEGTFQLRDVPYIQYFESGYALHGAYWHDVFGTPRSHGCVNLSPIDAHRVFMWTEPAVPEGWHAINVGPELGEGTTVVIHE
jgi:lipoprotein-anchoring transpeptidase ErfK/SrfK